MRNEMQEPGRGRLAAATRTSARTLDASVVDAAHGDEGSAPANAERGSRREFSARSGDASRVAIDESHGAVVSDGSLIRQLSRQLELLEAQQQQIRRLLELNEARFPAPSATRVDR